MAGRVLGVEALKRVVDVAFLHFLVFEIVLVDGQADAGHLAAIAVVDVDDEGHLGEGLADLCCRRAADLGGGPIDFGQERCQHRRAGRGLHDLEDGTFGDLKCLQLVAELESDFVAAAVALALFGQRDLHVAQLR